MFTFLERNKGWIFLLVLFFCLFGSLRSLKSFFPQGKITVKGYAEQKIISDYATWKGKLSARADHLETAYDQFNEQLYLVKGYLKEQGLTDQELTISPIYTDIFYHINEKGHAGNTIEGYRLHCDFSLHSHEIARLNRVAAQITDLIKEGLAIESFSPQYFYTKIDSLKINLLGEAAKDALARATQLVSASGSRVGPLRAATQGVFQITPTYSTTTSDYGENDTSTVEKSVKSVITMEYAIH